MLRAYPRFFQSALVCGASNSTANTSAGSSVASSKLAEMASCNNSPLRTPTSACRLKGGLEGVSSSDFGFVGFLSGESERRYGARVKRGSERIWAFGEGVCSPGHSDRGRTHEVSLSV